jgi:hypothetical protein
MSSPAFNLIELIAGEGLDAIRNRLLGRFYGESFPTNEWVAKDGVEMDFVNMVSRSLQELMAADNRDIAAGGFLGKAPGLWMDLLTESVFLLPRVPASRTTCNWELHVAETAQPQTWDVGDVEIVAESGNRYRNTAAGTAQPGGFAVLPFAAEAEGSSYNDVPGVDHFDLVTVFAGVTLQPAAPSFSSVHQLGTSTGQITPSGNAESHSYIVRIDVSGDVGSARYSIQADGGEWRSFGVLQRSQNVGFGSMQLSAVNGSGSPNSFVAGDTFAFTSPGSPELVVGRDAETNEHLADRCRSRWTTLSRNPTDGLFKLWAMLAVPSATRVAVGPDLPSDPTSVPGRVSMYVADSLGPIDPSALAQITAYVVPRLSVLDGFVARQAVKKPITISGSVLVTPTNLVSVQQAAERAWTAYLGNVPLGDVVRISKLVEILMDAGAVDVGNPEPIFMNHEDFDAFLNPGEVPVKDAPLIDSLTWMY